MLKKNKKKGFTLVEMILVIMIVGISATFVSTNYIIAKRKAELNVSSDRVLASLKENRSKVKSGYREVFEEIKEDEVLRSHSGPKCFGIRADKENNFIGIETNYENGNCIKENIIIKSSILSESSLEISDITIGNTSGFQNVDILFKPPTGEMLLFSDNLLYEERDLVIDIFAYNKSDETSHRYIMFDTVSGKMGVGFENLKN